MSLIFAFARVAPERLLILDPAQPFCLTPTQWRHKPDGHPARPGQITKFGDVEGWADTSIERQHVAGPNLSRVATIDGNRGEEAT